MGSGGIKLIRENLDGLRSNWGNPQVRVLWFWGNNQLREVLMQLSSIDWGF